MLQSVNERTKITKKESCAAYLAEDGKTWIDLPFDTVVSMNCWGFTPALFDDIEADFAAFLQSLNQENEMKAEYFLPFCVDTLCKAGKCDVKVYPTTSSWLGVTYPEDKDAVKNALKALMQAGEYPQSLWD
jgi:NDP-sugar pyrophosphorylase family protein